MGEGTLDASEIIRRVQSSYDLVADEEKRMRRSSIHSLFHSEEISKQGN